MSYLRCDLPEEAISVPSRKRISGGSALSELPTQNLAVLCEAIVDAGEGKLGLAERWAMCSLVKQRNVPFSSSSFGFFYSSGHTFFSPLVTPSRPRDIRVTTHPLWVLLWAV